MTSQTERRIAIYEDSDPFEADELETSRQETDHHRAMLLAKTGAVMAGLSLLLPAPRQAVMNLLHLNGHRPDLATLTQHNRNILSVKPDLNHPGLDRVVYRYGRYQTGPSFAAVAVAPESQLLTEAEYDLSTYPGANSIVNYGDTITFDINTANGDIVPNPDK